VWGPGIELRKHVRRGADTVQQVEGNSAASNSGRWKSPGALALRPTGVGDLGHVRKGRPGTWETSSSPGQPDGVERLRHEVVRLASGWAHHCALTADGRVWCWGLNASGQLGTSTPGGSYARALEVRLDDEVSDLWAGAWTTCARTVSGTILCWGTTIGELFDEHPPEELEIDGEVAELVLGFHACARLIDGEVRCWGRNGWGQLGRGFVSEPRSSPASVPGLRAAEVTVSGGSTCARRDDGTTVCWGMAGYGGLGNGKETMRLRPGPVRGLESVSALSLGTRTACAIGGEGRVSCWGGTTSGGRRYNPRPSLWRSKLFRRWRASLWGAEAPAPQAPAACGAWDRTSMDSSDPLPRTRDRSASSKNLRSTWPSVSTMRAWSVRTAAWIAGAAVAKGSWERGEGKIVRDRRPRFRPSRMRSTWRPEEPRLASCTGVAA